MGWRWAEPVQALLTAQNSWSVTRKVLLGGTGLARGPSLPLPPRRTADCQLIDPLPLPAVVVVG
ncbi:hypothetical protein J6590_053787 [Homalodisca vitripennis]|nr:hypothetical protein J6590_053787 [Homalodisca vitripennis]